MDTKLTLPGQKDSQFRVIHMPPDGSCLFHSICYSVYGNNLSTDQVREKIVNHVLTNWAKFQILTHDFKGDNYISPEHYRREMLKPSTYGSACELIAAAELFHCKFRVYYNGNLLQSFGVEGALSEYNLLFTGNFSSGHFDFLEASNQIKNNQISLIKSNVDHEINNENATETSPKPDWNTLSQPQCIQREVVNFEHDREQPKAKRFKQKAASPPTESSIKNNLIGDVLQEELKHVVVQKPENNAEEEKGKSKRKRTKRKGRFSNLPRLKQLREAATKYKTTHPEVNKAAVAKYTQQNPEVHRADVAKYCEKTRKFIVQLLQCIQKIIRMLTGQLLLNMTKIMKSDCSVKRRCGQIMLILDSNMTRIYLMKQIKLLLLDP